MSENILEIKNLSKYFGGLAAVSDCSLKIKKGTITGIIGPNGSGKTTLFNLISGNLKSSDGSILFNDEEITNVPSYELFSKGLLRTFQIAHEFTNLSVLENLIQRDTMDSQREVAPLKIAKNAIEIDVSDLSVTEVFTLLTEKIES